jgi:hypothetical protein
MIWRQCVAVVLAAGMIFPAGRPVYAQNASTGIVLPPAGAMVGLSRTVVPPVMKGLKVDPKDPFRFDFIMEADGASASSDGMADEAARLVRYFLTALTVPEKDLWVNLSPYEHERIIPEAFAATEMGRDLLSEDYLLKQITASLIYPEKGLGKLFWGKVYRRAYQVLGTTDIPADVFNKVWIVPNKAAVYEQGDRVFVVKASLKVLLDSDYQAAYHQGASADPDQDNRNRELIKDVLRQVIIPVLEREVNEGAHFTALRQIYYSLILAKWYKEQFRDGVLNRKYSDQGKVSGIDLAGPGVAETVYGQYVASFKKGVFNYIKEEVKDAESGPLPRKYFSGGVALSIRGLDRAQSLGAVDAQGRHFSAWSVAAVPVDVQRREPVDSDGLFSDRAQQTPDVQEVYVRGLRNAAWARTIRKIFRQSILSQADIQDLRAQVRHADVLRNILAMPMKPGDFVFTMNIDGRARREKVTGTAGSKGLTALWGIGDLNAVLGEKRTDEVIVEARNTFIRLMQEAGLVRDDGVGYTTYKQVVGVLAAGQMSMRDIDGRIAQVMDRLAEHMSEFLRRDAYAAVFRAKGVEAGQHRLPIRVGLSQYDPSSDTDPVVRAREKVLTVIYSTVAVKLQALKYGSSQVGSLFTWESLKAAVDEWEDLRRKIPAVLFGADGTLRQEVAAKVRDGMVWKDLPAETKAEIGYEASYEMLRRYVQLTGVPDYFGAWQLDFNHALIWSDKVQRSMDWLDTLTASGAVVPIDGQVRTRLNETLTAVMIDPKLPSAVHSALYFNALFAGARQDQAVISIDKIGMGLENLRSFEGLMGKMTAALRQNNRAGVEGLLMTVGHEVTRDFQESIVRMKTYLSEQGINIAGERMGGDEFVVLVDHPERLSPEVLGRIRKLTGTRVAAALTIQASLQKYRGMPGLSDVFGEVDGLDEKDFPLVLAFREAELNAEAVIEVLKAEEKKDKLAGRDPRNIVARMMPDGKIEKYEFDNAQADIKGGIDLNPAMFALDRAGSAAPRDWTAGVSMWERTEVDGLSPVIIGVKPVDSINRLMNAHDPAAGH